MIKNYIECLIRKRYQLGFLKVEELFGTRTNWYRHIMWITNPNWKKCWYADPFILDIKDNIAIVFAEEFEYQKCKGRLSVLQIDLRKKVIVETKPILELSSHLSFPYIFQEDNKIYVLPENYQSGSCSLFYFNSETQELINPIMLVKEPLVDTQLAKIDGYYYLFGTLVEPIGSPSSLHIYRSQTITGEYQEVQQINNTKREERGCGQLFYWNDMLIRPAMCCDGGYGTEMVFYELTHDSNHFIEREVYRMIPDRTKKNSESFHTFNMMGEWCIVDGEDFNCPLFARSYIPLLYRIQGKGKHMI